MIPVSLKGFGVSFFLLLLFMISFFISWGTSCVNPECLMNNLLLYLWTVQLARFCDTGSNLAKEQKQNNLCLGENHVCKMSAQGNFSQIIYSNYNSWKQVHNGIAGTTFVAAIPTRCCRGCRTRAEGVKGCWLPWALQGWDPLPITTILATVPCLEGQVEVLVQHPAGGALGQLPAPPAQARPGSAPLLRSATATCIFTLSCLCAAGLVNQPAHRLSQVQLTHPVLFYQVGLKNFSMA